MPKACLVFKSNFISCKYYGFLQNRCIIVLESMQVELSIAVCQKILYSQALNFLEMLVIYIDVDFSVINESSFD